MNKVPSLIEFLSNPDKYNNVKIFENEIDELLISLEANETDEWEGGLLCTPQNRKIVMNWLEKFCPKIIKW